ARAAFEARLLSDPPLAAFVREIETTVAAGIHALPRRTPPSSILERVEARISAPITAGTPAARPRRTGTVTWLSFARWSIAAAIALSLTTLAVQSLRHSSAQPMIVFVGLDSNRNTFVELPLPAPATDADSRFIQLASLAEKLWEKPGDLPVQSNLTLTGGRGYALIDPRSLQGFIAVEQLPPITGNQRYHLWVLDPKSGQIRDAGALPLAGSNSGLYSFMLGSTDDRQSARPNLFITVEDVGETSLPAQPHGKVVLGNHRI
ncbi:MAG TPA: anti-sigma factor, partial [Opitutus sp.]|nr:anti-sigma factor [Opitutus sp.]